MLGLAQEKLVIEGLNNLGLQLADLAKRENSHMLTLTENFISLKNKIETKQENPEIRKLSDELNALKLEFKNLQIDFSTLEAEVQHLKKKEAFRQEVKSEIIEQVEAPKLDDMQQEIIKRVSSGDDSVEGLSEKVISFCLTCKKKRLIVNPEIEETTDGGRMTVGNCKVCGRILSRIH